MKYNVWRGIDGKHRKIQYKTDTLLQTRKFVIVRERNEANEEVGIVITNMDGPSGTSDPRIDVPHVLDVKLMGSQTVANTGSKSIPPGRVVPDARLNFGRRNMDTKVGVMRAVVESLSCDKRPLLRRGSRVLRGVMCRHYFTRRMDSLALVIEVAQKSVGVQVKPIEGVGVP